MRFARSPFRVFLICGLAGLPACGSSGSGSGQPSSSGGSSSAGSSAQAGNAGAGLASSSGGSGGLTGSAGASGGFGGASAQAGAAGALGGAQNSGGASSAIGTGPLIDTHLFGQNYWSEGDTEALWPVVKASGVTLIRFGGAGADDEQPSNQRFADVATAIQAIGAEPYLQVSRHFDAARAKQVVDFVNNTQQKHVRYWSINNEPDIGANEPLMSVADSATLIKTLASAMKEADPTILIFAPETAYYDEAYLGPMLGGAQDITGKDANGRYFIDGVSFHSYSFGANYGRDQAVGAPDGFRGSVAKLLTALSSCNQKNGRTGTNSLQWGLTEFNMTYQNPADNSVDSFGVNSFLNGQFFAEIFGIAMANGALTVAPWSIHESNGNRGPTDLGYLDGPVGSTKPRSSYYHLQFLAQNFAGHYAPATSSEPLLRVVAAGDGSRVSVVLLNESLDQSYDFGVRLDKGQLTQPKSVSVAVDAALAAEYSGTIPAQATELLVFDATGKLSKRVDYAIADARSATAPRVTTP
jgi:hypothetical protein